MKISINDQILEADEGESILSIARANGIYIPALCYLSGCSPTLACRLCMAEANGKVVYSCNAKAKEDMQIYTNTPEIAAERNAIMQTYCVNHPIQCGVCDKSGECELQNLTTHLKVNEQKFAIVDTHKPHKKWGLINYDPALCIVCERCVTVCKDRIGESALKTVPRGVEVPKELKESMPKDAYAVFSKMQKSLIGPSVGESLDCSFCGECISVCPTGALISSHFQYSTNIWELNPVSAANPHQSDCELIYYDIKEKSTSDRSKQIYRVSNDFTFGEISGAARFGYDFHNELACKNEEKFEEIVLNIKNGAIKNIKFNSFITNEEALILERLREKFDLNLINNEALNYQKFLNKFSEFSGLSSYNADYEDIKNSDFIISAGSFLRHESPVTSFKLNNALKMNKAAGIYFHHITDEVVKKYSKNFIYVAHEAGKLEQIVLFILKNWGENLPSALTSKLENFDENFDLDVPALSDGKSKFTLILGSDFYTDENANLLAALTGVIARATPFRVMLIPPRTNSLGVAKICTLASEKKPGKTLGYNENGNYKFSIFEGDIDASALNQQEGTFTSINNALVPTNVAIPHKGYFLNDIANALGLMAKNTIDYTPNLPKEKGYKGIKFDDLENFYANDGTSHIGYKLEISNFTPKEDIESLFKEKNEPNLKDGEALVSLANPINLPSFFANYATQTAKRAKLYASSEFMAKFEISQNEAIILEKDGHKLAICVELDSELGGVAAYLGNYDDKLDVGVIFNGKSYAVVKIIKAKDE
ncbi:NADH-quinone oxidoreductase subunit G [Campylobacter concisus]|uniref:NADH-ubiquinone oxidoreductase chain G n=1 Tax=Campylobacter concisus ATCC 51562 TaxID=1242969 RepID=U2F9R8_9BACT|nr:NADH-quinone oxidoreductase subunit G [Campylobacter concisus]ERJ26735.1 NADH-ubiquinone oxidoreductase chain G [Campylobacter concisus ATCC 51562]